MPTLRQDAPRKRVPVSWLRKALEKKFPGSLALDDLTRGTLTRSSDNRYELSVRTRPVPSIIDSYNIEILEVIAQIDPSAVTSASTTMNYVGTGEDWTTMYFA